MVSVGVVLVALLAINKHCRKDDGHRRQAPSKRSEYQEVIENDLGDEPDNEVIPLELEVINRKRPRKQSQSPTSDDEFGEF